jgi:tetratricopeptide (TPR) repeat protein
VEKLGRSRTLKFPPSRTAQGLALLGGALVDSGKYAAALPVLTEAVQTAERDAAGDPRATIELARLLAVAQMRAPNPDNSLALKYLDQVLSASDLPTAHREQALLSRAEVLLRLKKLDDCQEALAALPPGLRDDPAVLVLKGRLAMARTEQSPGAGKPPASMASPADLATSRYGPAVRFFQAALKADLEKEAPTRQALVLIGVCRQRLRDTRGALADFDRVNKQFGETPEGAVANLEQADIYRRQNDDEQASAAYRRAVAAAGTRETYSNALVTLDGFQSRIAQAYRDYIAAKKFTEAIVITEVLSPLLTRLQSLRIAARTREDWAAELIATAQAQPSAKTAAQLRQARSLLRAAGASYVQLAEMEEDSKRQMDDRWSAARNFVAGQDYRQAVTQLREYLSGPSRTPTWSAARRAAPKRCSGKT